MARPPHLDSPRSRPEGHLDPFATGGGTACATARSTLDAVTTHEEPSQSSILSASRGDAVAIDEVLRAYLPRLQRFVHLRLGPRLRAREDTVDVVQSTVRELLAESRFEWRSEAEFRGWLFQAALNKLREKARFHGAGKRAADREVPRDAEYVDDPHDARTPSRIAMGHEALHTLETAFTRLTEPQREVLTLARIAGLPHAVIAARLGKSEVAVRQLLVRAMAALGAALGEELP